MLAAKAHLLVDCHLSIPSSFPYLANPNRALSVPGRACKLVNANRLLTVSVDLAILEGALVSLDLVGVFKGALPVSVASVIHLPSVATISRVDHHILSACRHGVKPSLSLPFLTLPLYLSLLSCLIVFLACTLKCLK